jgi:hypothetical protein
MNPCRPDCGCPKCDPEMAAVMSMAPHQYVEWLRINRAKIAAGRTTHKHASLRTTAPAPPVNRTICAKCGGYKTTTPTPDYTPPAPYSVLQTPPAPARTDYSGVGRPRAQPGVKTYVPPNPWDADLARLKGGQ